MYYEQLPYYLPRLEADQEIESWIENSLSICRLERQDLLARVCLSFKIDEKDPGDYDRAATALGAAIEQRYSNAGGSAPVGPSKLPKECRIGFCPLCFADDLHAGRLPYFRKAWANTYSTSCAVHRLPLFAWPYVRSDTGARFLPENLVRHHLEMPEIETAEARSKFIGILQLARLVRRIDGQGGGRSFAWRQQLLWERALAGQNEMSEIFGITPVELKRVVSDLSMVLLSNFGRGISDPLGNYMATFLGPRWLFGGHGPITPGPDGIRLVALRSIGSPARRRSAIALSIRILLSSYCDTSVSQTDCRMVQPGESFVTLELGKLPRIARKWLESRSKRWPEQVRYALSGAWNDCDLAHK